MSLVHEPLLLTPGQGLGNFSHEPSAVETNMPQLFPLPSIHILSRFRKYRNTSRMACEYQAELRQALFRC
jgi:hypothetical protein